MSTDYVSSPDRQRRELMIRVACEFQKGTLAEVMATCIAAQFHRFFVKNSGQQDCLSLCHQFVNQLVGTDLIRQGIVSHDGLSFSQTGFQSGNNRKRQFLQLLWGELSFLFPD